MIEPSDKEIQEAKDYIRLRLSAELSIQSHLEILMQKAAKDIIALSYKYNLPASSFRFSSNKSLQKEVNAILATLQDTIIEYTELLASATPKSDDSEIFPFLHRETFGDTLDGRTEKYVHRFKDEIQDFIAAGLLAHLSESGLLSEVWKYMKSPYSNPLVGTSTGRGQSAYHRLNTLTRFSIAEAWMHADMETAIRNGAIGFISMRGSSYPCSLCDDMTGFHTFAEAYPPYHSKCCCIPIPIYG
jgi:hypothetical protein|nr:MAG TPA: minor capsid protein [Caudoviricetes sp.]